MQHGSICWRVDFWVKFVELLFDIFEFYLKIDVLINVFMLCLIFLEFFFVVVWLLIIVCLILWCLWKGGMISSWCASMFLSFGYCLRVECWLGLLILNNRYRRNEP